MMRYALVLIGPSGVGKTSVANCLLAGNHGFSLVHSGTTRPKRGDGNDGEYIYYTREEFLQKIERGEVLEHTEFGGNLYGTPVDEVNQFFAEGKIPLLVLDMNGAESLYNGSFDFKPVILYIYEDIKTIEQRLVKRERENPSGKGMDVVLRRLEHNKRDYRHLREVKHIFDAYIKNTDLCEAADEALSVFKSVVLGNAPDREAADKIAISLADSVE